MDVVVRPALDGARAMNNAGFDGYVRSGATLEMKAFTGVTGDAGGYAVPREIDAVIDRALTAASPIRSVANVVRVGSAGYRKLVTTGGTPSGWAAETAARPETATPVFTEIVPPMGELYANPSASQAMLDDALFDVEDWLAGEIAAEFAKAEGTAFVTGSGVNRPKGFLTSATSSAGDATRPFGTLQYVASGAAGDFGASPQERLIDLVQSVRAAYRQGAVFVMNAATLARIRKFKTSDGAFVWQPSLAAGQPATLLGYPVIEAEDMPDVSANSLSIAFGNFKAGYLIAERSETAILRDPYSNKPFVNFYATKRVSMETSARLGLPLLAPGQAQKELFHNEAIAGIDLALQACVEEVGFDAPPAAPREGACWTVGDAPTGQWAGRAGAIAGWNSSGWRFVAAAEGMAVWNRAAGAVARFTGGVWVTGRLTGAALVIGGDQVVGPRQPAIAAPEGGATVDSEARAALAALLSAMRAHGLVDG